MRNSKSVPPLMCPAGGGSAEASSGEEAASGPYESEHSDAPHTPPDEGYEADVEVGNFDVTSEKTRLSETLPLSDNSLAGVASALGDESGTRSELGECWPGGELAHPELCLIVVDILTQIVNKVMDAVAAGTATEETWRAAAAGAGVCRAVAARLSRPNVANFTCTASPDTASVSILRRLLAARPARLLQVRCPQLQEQETMTSEGTGTVSPPNHQAEALAQRLREAHIQSGVCSAWRRAAAGAGVAEAGWAAWLQGFAATLRLQRLPTPPGPDIAEDGISDSLEQAGARTKAGTGALLHVFSLGNDSLLFEMWLEPDTGTILFRVSRPEAGAGAGGSEARVPRALPARRWTHVAVNVWERVTLFVNGYECETVSLPLQGILARKVTATNVLIGDTLEADANAGSYELSSIRVYRAPRLTRHLALHLAAHSPDHACHVRCESPNYASVLTANVLDSNIDWEQVYDMPFNVLREFHDSVLLTFSAHAPHVINLHHQTTLAMPSVFGGRGSSGGGGASAAPEGVRVRWSAAAVLRRREGLYAALHALGGAPHLLYLYARVVELETTAEEQASALRIVLQSCRGDGRLYHALYAAPPLDALLPVLRPAPRLLMVILEEACNAPILNIGGGGVLTVLKTTAALLEPELIALILRAWKQFDRIQDVEWEVEGEAGVRRGSLFELSLQCCGALLRLHHPRWRHNHHQLERQAIDNLKGSEA
ncbi:hypothetical protein evm_007825 [Chilo suppressalis]|nr:hypothetical protein evm_007825 [Chilo suppressalis]